MSQKIVEVDQLEGEHLFTVENRDGDRQEAFLIEHEKGIECWLNYCKHITTVKLHDGDKLPTRDEEIVCNNHGAMFDMKSGDCSHGPCRGSRLTRLEIQLDEGDVNLTDDRYTYLHDGGEEDESDTPSSTTGESEF